MPPATVDVDTDVFVNAGDAFLQVNDAVCDIVAAAATAAGEGAGMAGTDSSGVAWASTYDQAAAAAMRAGATLADRLGDFAVRLSVTGGNHANADAASTPGGPPVYSGDGAGTPSPGSVIPATPPSANGTPGDTPFGWAAIAHLLAVVWPNGHPDQLRAVGQGWTTASTALDAAADRLTTSIAEISRLTSPEVDAAVAACTDLQITARNLSAAYGSLGETCVQYAAALDAAHGQVTGALDVLGSIVDVVTEGLEDALAEIAQTVTTILDRLQQLVESFLDFLLGVVDRIKQLLEHLVDLLPERVVEVSGTGTPAVRPDWAKLSAMLRRAATEKGMFGMGTATREQTDAMGMAWVGPGATLASDGKTWVSADKLRQYRPPTWKPKEGKVQANFERREVPRGGWPHNGHVDVEG